MISSPIKLYNDYSLLDDDAMAKLANVVNNQEKTIKVTSSYDEAKQIARQNIFEGYPTRIVEHGNSYHINVKPRVEIDLQSAQDSGQFKKLAFNRYAFTKQANNPLGIQHYNFDDGSIWRVVVGKDNKEYLVKEVDDNNNDKVIRAVDSIPKSTVLTASSKGVDTKQLVRLAKILYNNPEEELINDLIKVSADTVNKTVTAKLNQIINSELEALNITSPLYRNKVKEKIAHAISSNIIFNRQQISKMIADIKNIDINTLNV